MSTWRCPRCGNRRAVTITKGGVGIPACPVDAEPMINVEEEEDRNAAAAKGAAALEEWEDQRDPDLAGEPKE